MASISAVRWEKHHKARKDLNVILAFFYPFSFQDLSLFWQVFFTFFLFYIFVHLFLALQCQQPKIMKIFHFSLILVAIIKSTKMVHSSMYSLLLQWVHFRRGFRVDTRHAVVNADWFGFFGNKDISFYSLAVTVIASCRILELIIFAPIHQTETKWNLSDLWLQRQIELWNGSIFKKKCKIKNN